MDGRPGDKETPLITAASCGEAEVAKLLIEAGADIDASSAPDSAGVPSGTAVDHAAVFGMTEVLDVLVAAGAKIHSLEMAAAAGDITGWPLARFTRQSRIRALVFAADHQRLDVIDQLIEAGTPVNEADAEWRRLPLHTAAGNGRAASVRRLLAQGASSSWEAWYGSSASWLFSQNCGVVPSALASRSAADGVIPRRPLTISFSRTYETPIRPASSAWVIVSSVMNSSSFISPGGVGAGRTESSSAPRPCSWSSTFRY
ncbi:MAG TPA: ankyrin repeat domain-containing protein [Streptosporangiaceae bacterium]